MAPIQRFAPWSYLALKHKMVRIKISILVSLVLLFGSSNLPVRGQVQITDEEYRIYSIALMGLNYVERDKQILITDQTISIGGPLSAVYHLILPPKFERIFDELESFETLDENPVKLFAKFDLTDYEMVYDDELTSLFKRETPGDYSRGWEALNAKYTNLAGLISFSRIAFDPKKRKCVVYVAMTCGPRCIQAEYVLLMKKKDVWSFNDRLPMFRSPNLNKR